MPFLGDVGALFYRQNSQSKPDSGIDNSLRKRLRDACLRLSLDPRKPGAGRVRYEYVPVSKLEGCFATLAMTMLFLQQRQILVVTHLVAYGADIADFDDSIRDRLIELMIVRGEQNRAGKRIRPSLTAVMDSRSR